MHKVMLPLDYNFVLKEQRRHNWILFLVTPSKRVAATETTFSQ